MGPKTNLNFEDIGWYSKSCSHENYTKTMLYNILSQKSKKKKLLSISTNNKTVGFDSNGMEPFPKNEDTSLEFGYFY